MRLFSYLAPYVRENQSDWVDGAQGSYQIFPDDPRKVRIPDGSDGTARWVKIGDILEGKDVLPGFACPVAAIFG
jgi:hypothetical protein